MLMKFLAEALIRPTFRVRSGRIADCSPTNTASSPRLQLTKYDRASVYLSISVFSARDGLRKANAAKSFAFLKNPIRGPPQ